MDGVPVKRGVDEGADHCLACLLNGNRLAGCHGLDLRNRIDHPLRHLGSQVTALRQRLESSAVRLHSFVHMMWQRTGKPGPRLRKLNDANLFKL